MLFLLSFWQRGELSLLYCSLLSLGYLLGLTEDLLFFVHKERVVVIVTSSIYG
jgi:hypothetical protein